MSTSTATPKKKVQKAPNLIQRRPGGNYYFRVKRTIDGKPKQIWISTGTSVLPTAKAEAARLMGVSKEAKRTGRWELMGMAKLRSDLPSLSALEDIYEEEIAKHAVRVPTPETRNDYWRNLRAVLAWARGSKGQPGKVDPSEITVLALAAKAGGDVVKNFRANWLAAAPEGDLAAEAARRRSGDSMLRQARACFGQEAMQCYKKWAFPDLQPFMAEAGFGSVAKAHVDIAPQVLTAMAEAASKLLDENPRLYIVHLAHKFFGLRNSEIAEARVGWFQAVRWEADKPLQWMMEVSERCGFRPKASEGSVPIKREVAVELAKAWAKLDIKPDADPMQYMVPAQHETDRHNVIYYEHAAFIRQFLPREDFSKAGYELRRWAFRTMQSKTGSREAAKAFIRHKMPADAGRHYQARFYPWATLGDDVGLSLLEARGGASTMTTATVEKSAWADLV